MKSTTFSKPTTMVKLSQSDKQSAEVAEVLVREMMINHITKGEPTTSPEYQSMEFMLKILTVIQSTPSPVKETVSEKSCT